ncbi:hypothetical protein PWT90_00026 [Aphanocladium album]|nr:hypothetical protein PWT90_00026 [Aphanocladium album]
MAEALRDLLGLDAASGTEDIEYLEYLADLSLESVLSSEPQNLAQNSQSMLRSVQALSKRSHKLMVGSAIGHASIPETIRILDLKARELTAAVPRLDTEAERFSTLFSKSGDSRILAQRKEALHLLDNADRVVDLLELPALLLSAVNASPLGYSTSLDLYGHIRRLSALYPNSDLVRSVMLQADDAIRQLAIDLIGSLTAPNLKLAAALRTMGWLKRIVPELVPDMPAENSLPAVFLICRFSNLVTTLEALDPLRKLADEERIRQHNAGQTWSGGQQTERFLKRFIEVFREHSFNIISISKNAGGGAISENNPTADNLGSIPPVLSAFPMHLVSMLLETLRIYLPVVKDQASRESILTQVLYCSGSLGRLGADFGMLLPSIGVHEWPDLVKRHRLLAGRLESVIADYKAPTTASA